MKEKDERGNNRQTMRLLWSSRDTHKYAMKLTLLKGASAAAAMEQLSVAAHADTFHCKT